MATVDESGRSGPTRGGQVRIGAWSIMGGRGGVEALCRSGVDFVGIDAQHGFFAFDQAALCVQIVNLCGVRCFVRVPIDQFDWIPRYLDAGADGVILAMVSAADEVEQAVALSRYQTIGRRSWAGGKRNGVGESGTAIGAPEIFAMIETAQALEHLEEIAAVPGLGGLYVGPVDLGLAMERPHQVADHDEAPWRDAVNTVVVAARDSHIRSGMFAIDGEDSRDWIATGFQDIVLSSDIAILRRGLDEHLRRARTPDSQADPVRGPRIADPWRGWSPQLQTAGGAPSAGAG